MTWLARLKSQQVPNTQPTETTETHFVVSAGTQKGAIEKSVGSETATAPPRRALFWKIRTIPGYLAAREGSRQKAQAFWTFLFQDQELNLRNDFHVVLKCRKLFMKGVHR